MSEHRRYLGDGVYVDRDLDMIRLTTENGIAVTNEIFLEPAVYRALLAWVTEAMMPTNDDLITPDTTCDNEIGRTCRELWPQDRASWCEGCVAAAAERS